MSNQVRQLVFYPAFFWVGLTMHLIRLARKHIYIYNRKQPRTRGGKGVPVKCFKLNLSWKMQQQLTSENSKRTLQGTEQLTKSAKHAIYGRLRVKMTPIYIKQTSARISYNSIIHNKSLA